MQIEELKNNIEKFYSAYIIDTVTPATEINDLTTTIDYFLKYLNQGKIRSAEKQAQSWIVNSWIKKGILLLFKLGKLQEMILGNNDFIFFDKDTVMLRKFELSDGVRIVPGGSAIRNGVYVGKDVICMPPMYINIGAYVDEGTMVDSHALIGTCAQIGKRVHISAAAQIGGVLEPIGANPVIIEDNVMIGGNCGIYEGVIIKQNAILGSGVILNSSVKVYDLINNSILISSETMPLTIPENAVVVQGARGINTNFGKENNLSISTPIIVKYRDAKTDAKTELENALR